MEPQNTGTTQAALWWALSLVPVDASDALGRAPGRFLFLSELPGLVHLVGMTKPHRIREAQSALFHRRQDEFRQAKRDLEFADELCTSRNEADKRQWARERESG